MEIVMAGAACKVIIDNMRAAVDASLREVLVSPLVRGPMITAEKSDGYLQRMVDLDLRVYTGRRVGTRKADSLAKICKDLQADGVFTQEIWQILAEPAEAL